MAIDIQYQLLSTIGQGAAQARGLSASTRAVPIRGAQRAARAMRKRGFQSLVSEARALREYACDATANRKLCM
eukprot:1591146-Pleurochrysis_carterae.AAC.3